MKTYQIFLTSNSIIEADIYQRDNDDIYLGTVYLNLDELQECIDLCQTAVDQVIIQICKKAGVITLNKGLN